ncbi:efflux RND transporter permease subunit [Nostoc commune]|uniref:efflux RND transporter permease subunit n=1 Tax=Nostoc commune TaxID=1178 RepID=UPI001E37701F|nr:efflux RND transporter permease subunit [Nostoc commune]
MLDYIVKWSIAQRWLIVIASILISVWGFLILTQMPLDVFPNFAPPQVEIMTEAPGLAAEEVESLVTRPIESAINATPGLEALRSSSAVGLSAVRATFSLDTEIYRARQLVTERLQQARSQLPQGVEDPEVLPVSSPLGWTVKYAFTSETTPLMEVWRIVNWQVKNRLLAVPGVSNIVVFGGDERQYQVLVNPDKLKAFNVSLDDVTKAAAAANANAPGGFLITPDQETLVRGVGRIESIEQLKKSVIKAKNGTPVLLEQVADVQIGAALKRGDGSFAGKKAVILTVNKQPTADTPKVTKAVEKAIEEIQAGLPKDVKITTTFRQEDFIEASIENVEEALKKNPGVETAQLRSGRAVGDTEVAGVNGAEIDVQLSEEGAKDRDKTIETIRKEFDKIPGVVPNIGGFISHRMDEVLSGVRSAIAVKIFGPDLEQLRTLGQQVQSAMGEVSGLVDLQLEPQVPIKQVQIQFDRDAAARYGLTIGELSEVVETALNGRVVSQVLEQQQTFDMVVWLQEKYRNNIEIIGNLLVDTPNGQKIPLAQVAKINYATGPNTINRENVSRYIVVSSNVAGRDLGSVIKDIRERVKQQVQLPAGYFIEYGGQFEAQEGATKTLLSAGALAFMAIALILYFAVKSIPATIMILINLPLALIGGVISIALTSGIISVASMVGFITLFGVAARNGVLDVSVHGEQNKAITDAKLTAQVQLPDGSNKTLQLPYNTEEKQYTAKLPATATVEYKVVIQTDVKGEKFNGRFTFKR